MDGGSEGKREATSMMRLGVRVSECVCVCVCLTPEEWRGSPEVRASEGRKSLGAEGR